MQGIPDSLPADLPSEPGEDAAHREGEGPGLGVGLQASEEEFHGQTCSRTAAFWVSANSVASAIPAFRRTSARSFRTMPSRSSKIWHIWSTLMRTHNPMAICLSRVSRDIRCCMR